MHSGLCCGLYRGRFFLKDLSSENNPLLPVGNAEANITQELTEIEQPNFQSLGGSACKVAYVESLNMDLILHCTSPENMAIAFMGEAAKLTGGSVTGEEHAVNAIGELIPFERVPDRNLPIVVSPAEAGEPYEAGVDYVVTGAGIEIIEGSSIPVDGSLIKVDYSYGANWKLDAQTVGQKEFMVVLDGVNVGEQGNRTVVLKAWKVKFNPVETFALISGSDFASLELSGEILRDDTKATGSKFFTTEWGATLAGVY